jgi:hypothetical protein
VIVATERLGTPGDESGWLERRGIEQKRLTYPNNPDQPTATCHLQQDEHQNALCGYQWEGLVPVPGAELFNDVPVSLRCPSAKRPTPDPEHRIGGGYRCGGCSGCSPFQMRLTEMTLHDLLAT